MDWKTMVQTLPRKRGKEITAKKEKIKRPKKIRIFRPALKQRN
jgi:hypothetical protein